MLDRGVLVRKLLRKPVNALYRLAGKFFFEFIELNILIRKISIYLSFIIKIMPLV